LNALVIRHHHRKCRTEKISLRFSFPRLWILTIEYLFEFSFLWTTKQATGSQNLSHSFIIIIIYPKVLDTTQNDTKRHKTKMPPKSEHTALQTISADEETPLFLGTTNDAKHHEYQAGKCGSVKSWLRQHMATASIGLLLGVGIATAFHGGARQHQDHEPFSVMTTTTTTTTSSSTNSPPTASKPEEEPRVDSSSSSSYKKFQGLSFQIYTGGAPAFIPDEGNTTLIDNPECLDRNSYGHFGALEELQCYLGLDDEKEDVEQRLRVMTDAVERAYEASDKDPSILKIFVAPEFFWRGLDGAYNFDPPSSSTPEHQDCGSICQVLRGLETLVEEERFNDWLFLFGTVIASEALPTEDPFDYLFYNFAPLYKGGKPNHENRRGKRFLVPKRIVSNMDFLTPERFFNHSISSKELMDQGAPERKNQATTVLNPYMVDHFRYDNTMWSEYKTELSDLGYTMVEYSWLKMDNITFTVEICVDHDAHTAKNAYDADMVSGRKTLIPSGGGGGGNHGDGGGDGGLLTYTSIPSHQAQISLVASAGMTLNKDSMVLVNDGAILLQDGDYDDVPRQFFGNAQKRTNLQFEGGSELVRRRAVLTPTEIYFEYSIVDGKNFLDLVPVYEKEDAFVESLEGIFSITQYEPSIVVYDPIEIAQV
jgi:hypothetical protein